MQIESKKPDLKHLVLLGGGHAQIAVLKSLAMKPIEGLRITLISRDVMTPYSGMLPGYLEGCYRGDEITIDLSHMARHAGARFIHAEAEGIDPKAKTLSLKGRPKLSYDVLSVNIGSNPDLKAIKGAEKFAIPVKPISTLLNRITPVIEAADTTGTLTIIGGGAAGVEVALALDHLMKKQMRKKHIRLIHRGERIMPEFPNRAAKILSNEMRRKGIEVMVNIEATEIKKTEIALSNDHSVQSDQTLIVTQGRAPPFLKKSGISLDARGFIAVRPTLQSQSHEDIFASGDIATVIESPRPKAGVFAVRAGAILTRNIRAYVTGAPLKSWVPQKNYLALVGTGGARALPIRGPFVLPPSQWAWHLKKWIDVRFIKKFTDWPEMPPLPSPKLAASMRNSDDPALKAMRCLGCGAKTGWGDLGTAINHAEDFMHSTTKNPPQKVDISTDSASMKIADSKTEIIQSIDSISALINDPFMLGRIAALHALSDLYASHADPHHALAMLTIPAAISHLQQEDIAHILAGAMLALNENGAYLAGGHTAQAQSGEHQGLQVGFAVTGVRKKAKRYAPKDGDSLIITKPIGIGMIMAGHNQGHVSATGQLRAEAINVMAQSNGIAARILSNFSRFPMTDVTGFGLMRHLTSLLSHIDRGPYSAELIASALPLIGNVRELALGGVESSLTQKNKVPYDMDGKIGLPQSIFADPQTGGGLLAIIPKSQCQDILGALKAEGVRAAHIGIIKKDQKARITVRATW